MKKIRLIGLLTVLIALSAISSEAYRTRRDGTPVGTVGRTLRDGRLAGVDYYPYAYPFAYSSPYYAPYVAPYSGWLYPSPYGPVVYPNYGMMSPHRGHCSHHGGYGYWGY